MNIATALQKRQKHGNYSNLVIRVQFQHWYITQHLSNITERVKSICLSLQSLEAHVNKPLSLLEAHTQLTRICKLSTTWSVVASIVTPYFVRISSLSRLVISSSILQDKWSMKLSLCRFFFHFENKFLFLFMLSVLCIATGPHCYLYIYIMWYHMYAMFGRCTFLACTFCFPNSDHVMFSWEFSFGLFISYAHMCRWRRLFPKVVSFGVKWGKHTS